MRENCNQEELDAHYTLDLVKAGGYASDNEINRALFVLGDGVGIVQLRRSTCNPTKSE